MLNVSWSSSSLLVFHVQVEVNALLQLDLVAIENDWQYLLLVGFDQSFECLWVKLSQISLDIVHEGFTEVCKVSLNKGMVIS